MTISEIEKNSKELRRSRFQERDILYFWCPSDGKTAEASLDLSEFWGNYCLEFKIIRKDYFEKFKKRAKSTALNQKGTFKIKIK